MPSTRNSSTHVLYLIAAFKILKALTLLAIAIGIRRLLHRDIAAEIYSWANAFRVDPGNRYLHGLFVRFAALDDKKLRELSVGTLLYSALFWTEGTGLFLRKRWAEYLTLVATFSFIPLELYELTRRATLARGAVLVLNIAVVAYLAIDLYRHR
jgi:uncharacterized membrane protein (DUF2068 family)